MDKPVGLREHVELARYTSTSAFCNHTSCLSRLCHRLIAESSFLSFHLEYRCERDICFLCGNHSRHLSAAALSDGPDATAETLNVKVSTAGRGDGTIIMLEIGHQWMWLQIKRKTVVFSLPTLRIRTTLEINVFLLQCVASVRFN